MKFVRLSDQRRINSGHALILTEIQKKLPEHMPGVWDKKGAADLWNPLPESCGRNAVFYSDLRPAYEEAFPRHRHFSVGKESGKTSHVERFNLTLRQSMSRLGRKTLSFSKNMKNNIGALWNFIHHHNENIAPNLATTS